MFNIINGGKHAHNAIDIQETMIVPWGLKTFKEKLRAGSEIYHHLSNILDHEGFSTGLGDEGGFAPELAKNEEVFLYVKKAIVGSGYSPEKIRISIDLAATELFDKKTGKYHLKNENKDYSSSQLSAKLIKWAKKYQLFSIEDGLSEIDPSWKELTKNIAPTLTIGDDLFTTDAEKIELGVKEKMAGGVIIKPNQIGTLTETFEAIRCAQEGKMKVIISHRSGETEDSFIADLAVAVQADYLKAGAPARSERLAKYNRLCKIEDELNKNYHEGR
jgi:enolase